MYLLKAEDNISLYRLPSTEVVMSRGLRCYEDYFGLQ
jgi:hypothetical protein